MVIPARDEAGQLGATLATVLAWLGEHEPSAEVIVVDDGSTDGTADVAARTPGIRLVRRARGGGKGAALRDGVAASTGDTVLLCDADLSVPIDAWPAFAAALAGGAGVVVGSRRSAGSRIVRHQPRRRRVAGMVYNVAARGLFSLPVRDVNCGFKGLDGALARRLFAGLHADGWEIDVELLAAARAAGARFAEVPVTWTHRERTRPNISVTRTGATTALRLLRLRLRPG